MMMSFERPRIGPLSWLARRMQLLRALLRSSRTALSQVLVVVEGPNDIAFLRHISAMLHREGANLPDLSEIKALGGR
jgi:hypothetical protein